jgi:hypothetical protein
MKYEEDPDWIDKINENQCPYCEEDFQHVGIKRECGNCGLVIYGNPLYLMYQLKLKKETKKPKDWIDLCTHSEIFYDDIRSENVCLDCGLLLSGVPHYVCGDVRINYPEGYIFEDNNNPLRK